MLLAEAAVSVAFKRGFWAFRGSAFLQGLRPRNAAFHPIDPCMAKLLIQNEGDDRASLLDLWPVECTISTEEK
jgi:hypothetical protein